MTLSLNFPFNYILISISLRKSLIEEIFISMVLVPKGATAGWGKKALNRFENGDIRLPPQVKSDCNKCHPVKAGRVLNIHAGHFEEPVHQ
jgi:hypothetical protein